MNSHINTFSYNLLEDDKMRKEEREELLSEFLEVKIKKSDDFLRVKETLTRIGLTARGKNELIQSCHILHKQGKYYICGFGELFSLDGKPYEFTREDALRRNRIANLLESWGLIEILKKDKFSEMIELNRIKIIPFKDKGNWVLKSNYTLGSKIK